MKIQIILLGIILFLFGNAYALDLHCRVDKYSLNNRSLPLVKKQPDGYLHSTVTNMINSFPSLIKFNDSYGNKESIENFSRGLIYIPNQNIETGNGRIVTDTVRDHLISRLKSLAVKNKTDYKTNLICNPDLLFDFYVYRKIKPVWVTKDSLNNKAKVFIKTIIEADHEGLDASIYHRDDILSLVRILELNSVFDAFEPAKYAELELLLTDAFFSYGFHLSEGVVEPNQTNVDWHIEKPNKNLLKILRASLNNEKIEELVDILQPHHSGYLRLKSALLKYQYIKKSGGWHKIPVGPKLRKGDTEKRIAALRSRLIISGDLSDSTSGDGEYFDEALESGVKKFQARNGLKTDGVVGSNTLSALNISVEDRIGQIKLNMERWRWLPQDLGKRYILVNTANFELDIIENGETVTSTRAIVGKKKRPTPALSQKITYMELNPYWNVPHRIAINDILPCVKKDSNYLKDKNIRIFENWEDDAKEVNPESIDWNTVTKKNFGYKLRQDPANSNALGRVKFIFPNEFSIYLHDTPARTLFNKTKRTFSSGCIRIEKPMELAAYLLTDNSKWTYEKLTAAVDSKKTRTILLSDPINIHILYWTAWVDKNGIVNFRDDIYGRDRQLNIALNEKIHSPEVRYGKKSDTKFLSFQTLPESNPPMDDISKIGSLLVTNSIRR
ncbi:MAG: L,D-transpeptidase family protein [Desulfobacterales bacterium]